MINQSLAPDIYVNTTTFAMPTTQPSVGNAITEPLDIFALVFMAVLFTVGVFGNIFIIYVLAVVNTRKLGTHDLLVISLSISDLVCVIIVPSIFAYGTISRFRRWDFGLFGCKVLLSVLPVNVTTSQGILILMSLDRYFVLAKPLQRDGFSKRRTPVYIFVVIIVATLLVLPRAYSLEIHYNAELSTKTCTSAGSNNRLMLSSASINLVRDIVSTIVIAASGRKIYSTLKSSSISLANFGCIGVSYATSMSHVKQAHRMLRLILIVFSICTIPLDAFQFCVYVFFQVQPVIQTSTYYWIRSVNTLLYLFQTSNAIVNAFIYGSRHRDFRPILRKISRWKRDFTFKVSPKSQCADLSPDITRNGVSPSNVVLDILNEDIRTTKIVQFSFDGFMN